MLKHSLPTTASVSELCGANGHLVKIVALFGNEVRQIVPTKRRCPAIYARIFNIPYDKQVFLAGMYIGYIFCTVV
jgi:hypothetical protein